MTKELEDVIKEIEFAERKFAEYNGSHEGYSIIAEELDELWELVRAHNHNYNHRRLKYVK